MMRGFTPDAESNTPGICTAVSNMIPYRAGMEASPTQLDVGGNALAAACTGAVTVTKLDGTRRTFAGASTKLYEFATPAWTDRSVGAGSYTANSIWQFCHFGDATIATNYSDAMQHSSSGAFANITGPKAKVVESVVTSGGGFVFAFNTSDGTYGVSPDRWWCSALNDHTLWTVSTATQCATGRLLGAGGPLLAGKKFGADSIVAYKASSLYHGRYVGGSVTWQFTEVPEVGAVGARAVCDIGFAHFIVAQDGFWLYDGSRPVQIGEGQVRQWYSDNVNPAYANLVECVYEKDKNRVWVFFPDSTSTTLNRALVWHIGTKEWGYLDASIQTALVYIGSGITFDGVTGTFDAITQSVDSSYWTAATRNLAVFGTDSKLKTYTGTPGSSYFQTADHGDLEHASRINEFYVAYAMRPTAATAGLYTSHNLGGVELTGPTGAANDPPAPLGLPGRFTLMQQGRWHRAQFNFTGGCRVTGYKLPIMPAGRR